MNDADATEQVKAAMEAPKEEVKKKPAKSFEEIEKRIEESRVLAERIEKANAKAEEILQRQESIRGRDVLGGRSEAGIIVPEKTPEQKQKDEINKYLEQTGFKI